MLSSTSHTSLAMEWCGTLFSLQSDFLVILLVPLRLKMSPSLQQRHCSSSRAACAVQVFLVTEYVSGWDLGSALSRDRQRPRQTGWHQQGHLIALGIARGLAYLHSNGVLWFSCKPSNVLLDRSGAVAKIADFGLAGFLAAMHSAGQMVSAASLSWVALRCRSPVRLGWPLTQVSISCAIALILWSAVSTDFKIWPSRVVLRAGGIYDIPACFFPATICMHWALSLARICLPRTALACRDVSLATWLQNCWSMRRIAYSQCTTVSTAATVLKMLAIDACYHIMMTLE